MNFINKIFINNCLICMEKCKIKKKNEQLREECIKCYLDCNKLFFDLQNKKKDITNNKNK